MYIYLCCVFGRARMGWISVNYRTEEMDKIRSLKLVAVREKKKNEN